MHHDTVKPAPPMDRARLARALLVASIGNVIAFYFVGSALKPGYSQISNGAIYRTAQPRYGAGRKRTCLALS
jgi:hypothetical protein